MFTTDTDLERFARFATSLSAHFDELANTWVMAQTITGIGEDQGIQVPNIGPARVFFQYVLLSAGTADSGEVFVAPL